MIPSILKVGLSFFTDNWRLIAIAVAAIACFWAGHNVASTACDADKAKLIAAQYEQQTKTIEKVRHVQTKIASMPAGTASNELFTDWARQ